ncbi:hypothetical protein E2C01_091283 [Portunus trituberculatus]|uniref:Secreted protein n=1 Tax=Portunus trituberculatus TaxID=210409 RepID=A0A5B7JSJ6_PORTR|nr:hypothetical protein [Portunus trituberculatus]
MIRAPGITAARSAAKWRCIFATTVWSAWCADTRSVTCEDGGGWTQRGRAGRGGMGRGGMGWDGMRVVRLGRP